PVGAVTQVEGRRFEGARQQELGLSILRVVEERLRRCGSPVAGFLELVPENRDDLTGHVLVDSDPPGHRSLRQAKPTLGGSPDPGNPPDPAPPPPPRAPPPPP